MKSFFQGIFIIFLLSQLLSCAGQPLNSMDDGDDEFTFSDNMEDEEFESDDLSSSSDKEESSLSSDSGDEFDSLDKDLEQEQKTAEAGDFLLDEDPLIKESKKENSSDDLQAQTEVNNNVSEDPFLLEEKSKTEPPSTFAEEIKDPFLETPPSETTPSIAESSAEPPVPAFPDPNLGGIKAEISNIHFQSNEGGGTIIIEGNQPLDFTTRYNSQNRQFIIEVRNAHLQDRLKRPFITKDFQSTVGSIDAFQTPGSETVRIVVQMKEGGGEPTAHSEGGTIVVIPTNEGSQVAQNSPPQNSDSDYFSNENKNSGIFSSSNLEQFLSGNLKYYGKKISIEVKEIDVRSAINLIAEESGANLVMSESVTGNIALKLKNVPWDQALVLILKAKKLGYTRQGNVLRISLMSEIKAEEEEAMKLAESRRKVEPLKVQMIPINYAKITELQAQIKTVITERGSIVADVRSNSLIITETDEVLERAKKIISSLDIAPAQVLIEGKIVEARDVFTKKIGVNWNIAGQPLEMDTANLTPNLNIRPGAATGGSLGFSLTFGTLDILGDLGAVLALEEQEENVKVISSPRIVTLHNVEASITQSATIAVLASEATSLDTKLTNRTYKDLSMKMELRVTPEVANNGIVQMQVDITREFPGAPRDNGGANSNSRSAKTKVMVKSGQTAVIGGIYQNDATEVETGVPFLKDIPVLGALFRGKNYTKNKTELLLFLTPRVLSQAGGGPAFSDASHNSYNLDDNKNQSIE